MNKFIGLIECVHKIFNYFNRFLWCSVCLKQGSQTVVHLGFSRGTILCERISLFKLNFVFGRNNRLKCLEFFNLVDCYYIKQDN